jgi:hypothetical protein
VRILKAETITMAFRFLKPGHLVRALTALLSIALGVALGVVWFIIHGVLDPIPPPDVRFYVNLYAEIGAASGLFSWYMATPVEGRRVRLGSAMLVVAIPFFSIFLLSLNLNPLTACAVVAIFALAVIPSCVVAARSHRQTRLAAGERPASDGGNAQPLFDSRGTDDGRQVGNMSRPQGESSPSGAADGK